MARRGDQDPPLTLFSFQDIVMSVSGVITLLALLIGLQVTTSAGRAGGGAAAAQVADRSAQTQELERQQEALTEQLRHVSQPEGEAAATGPGLQELQAARQAVASAAQELAGQAQALAALKAQEATLADTLEELRGQAQELDVKVKQQVPDWIQLKAERPTTAVVYLVECSGRQIRCGRVDEPAAAVGFDASAAGQERLRETLAKHRGEDIAVVFMVKPSAIDYALDLAERLRRQTALPVGYDALLEDQVVFPRR